MHRAVLATLFIGACGGATPAGSPAAPSSSPSAASADAAFTKLVDEFFDAGDRYSPTQAVGNGFHAYDAQIEDRSRARMGRPHVPASGAVARSGAGSTQGTDDRGK